MSRMEIWTTYILLIVFLVMGGFFVYATYQSDEKMIDIDKGLDNLGKSDLSNQFKSDFATSTLDNTDQTNWREIYPNTVTIMIGETIVNASLAKTLPEVIKGLSDTPYLPEDVVKLFIFDQLGFHPIWMKDMNYSIDILWLNKDKEIIHIIKEASPDSFPETFTPDQEALYVVETVAGFVDNNSIKIGDKVSLSEKILN
ncbi:MAG: DUF192 domain-containing protein [Candidatus Paceibacterota bacterium]